MSHYYHKNGESCYEVPMSKDPSKMRPSTLRDARKLDLLASVTTFMSDMIAKKNLNDWIKKNVAKICADIFLKILNDKSDQSLSAGILISDMLKIDGSDTIDKDLLVRQIIVMSDIEVNEAAKFGNMIHDMVQEYAMTRKIPDNPRLMPYFEEFKVWWDANIERVYFAETTVVGDCYAGRLDLVAEFKSGENLIIDWKTRKRRKPTTKAEKEVNLGKFGTYETDIIQLCAYRKAIMKMDNCPRIDGVANVFIDSENPTPPHLHRWTDEQIEQHTHCWDYLAKAWCWLKNYHPKVEGGIDVNA